MFSLLASSPAAAVVQCFFYARASGARARARAHVCARVGGGRLCSPGAFFRAWPVVVSLRAQRAVSKKISQPNSFRMIRKRTGGGRKGTQGVGSASARKASEVSRSLETWSDVFDFVVESSRVIRARGGQGCRLCLGLGARVHIVFTSSENWDALLPLGCRGAIRLHLRVRRCVIGLARSCGHELVGKRFLECTMVRVLSTRRP